MVGFVSWFNFWIPAFAGMTKERAVETWLVIGRKRAG